MAEKEEKPVFIRGYIEGYVTQPPPPPKPVKEKRVTYWEDKSSGNYYRNTVTQKTNAAEYRRYDTVTFGNKFTGKYSTKTEQSSEFDKYYNQ